MPNVSISRLISVEGVIADIYQHDSGDEDLQGTRKPEIQPGKLDELVKSP